MRAWLHGMSAAAIGGLASAMTATIAVPEAVNLTPAGLIAMGKIAFVGALMSVMTYLKQSPLPGPCVVKESPKA